MTKLQQLAKQRLADARAKWRTDTGDAELVEAYLEFGRRPNGYTDDFAGRMARLFDLNGRLSIAQVANIRRAVLGVVRHNDTPAEEPKQKRKYTRRTNV
mgnify:CR=1 FL=1